MGCLHDAEELLGDYALTPLYTTVTADQLRENLTGVCRDPRGGSAYLCGGPDSLKPYRKNRRQARNAARLLFRDRKEHGVPRVCRRSTKTSDGAKPGQRALGILRRHDFRVPPEENMNGEAGDVHGGGTLCSVPQRTDPSGQYFRCLLAWLAPGRREAGCGAAHRGSGYSPPSPAVC